jgi:hypothetical protein
VAVLLSLTLWFLPLASLARNDEGRYQGIEFYGSSQITRLELEKMLGLRKGGSASSIASAMARLKKQLDARHLDAHAEVVKGNDDDVFVVIDIADSSVEEAPTRRLNYLHHVDVRTEKPFLLLADLDKRLDEVNAQGREVTEYMTDGYKSYSDEPANAIVREMCKYTGQMREEFLGLVEADPNPARRIQACELLGWAGAWDDTTARLIPAIDDSDPYVRAAVDRFIFPRLSLLPPQFPYAQLVDAWSRQITRGSHEDRSKGLYCLLAVCVQHPELVKGARLVCGKRVHELSETTILPTVKTPADKLLALFAKDAAKKPPQGLPFLQ